MIDLGEGGGFIGGLGKTVEIDEAFLGRRKDNR